MRDIPPLIPLEPLYPISQVVDEPDDERSPLDYEVSREGMDFIARWEGVRTEAYPDTGGRLTIGIGHLLTDWELERGVLGEGAINWRNGLTMEQVMRLFDADLERREQCVRDRVTIPLTQKQFDVLVSFVYNAGCGAFARSTLRKVLNRGMYGEVPAQLRRWIYDDGRVIKGLVRRREAEASEWNQTP